MKRFFLAAASMIVVGALLPGPRSPHAMTAGEMVQTRRALFDEMTEAMKYIINHWEDSASYGNIAQAGALIERDAKALPKLFPAGTGPSDGFRTAASTSIWTDRQGFDQLASQLAGQAASLAQTTASTDSAQLKGQIKDVITTCKSCHRDYRN